MKKSFALFLTAALLLTATPTWAATTSYVDHLASVQEETEFTLDTAPVLGIRASGDHRGVFTFMLVLDKAVWTYEGTGEIATGVTYTRVTDSMLTIRVDTDEADANNSQLLIPLLCRLTEAGAATVTIDPLESMVSPATHTFAESGMEFGGVTYSIEETTNFTDKGELGALVIEDENTNVVQKGEVYRLQLDNGCIFTDAGSLTALGKYAGAVDVYIDADSPSVLCLEMKKDTLGQTGKLVLDGVQIATTEDSEYGSVNLTLKLGDGREAVAVGNKVRPEEMEPAEPEKTEVCFTIGQATYTIDGTTQTIPTAPFIDENGRTLLPLRAVANALGIEDEAIQWNDSLKAATITQGEKTLTAYIGSKTLMVDGQAVEMDTQAVIQDGYTFLPLRAVLNGLGVADEDILWDEAAKTVTVYR